MLAMADLELLRQVAGSIGRRYADSVSEKIVTHIGQVSQTSHRRAAIARLVAANLQSYAKDEENEPLSNHQPG